MTHDKLPMSHGPLPWLILAGVLITGGMIAAQQFTRSPAIPAQPPVKSPEPARSDDPLARTVLAELRASASETEGLRRQLADEQTERKKLAAEIQTIRNALPTGPT